MSITPLGSPVLPLEKMMVARSSSDFVVPPLSERSSEAPGKIQSSSAISFSPRRGAAAASSIRIVLPGTVSGIFSSSNFVVMTVSILHCAAQEASASFGQRVVQIHGNFACEHGREIHERGGNRRRQQNADHFLAGPFFAQAARKKNRTHQHAAPLHARMPPVRHGKAK